MKTKNQSYTILVFALFLISASLVFGVIVLENMKEARTALGLNRYPFNQKLAKLKIAVIDNGFTGFEGEKNILPASAKLITKYAPDFINKFQLGDPKVNELPSSSEHGRVMAQLVWAMTGANAEGPQFYLLNANGITNFKRAVRYAIEEKVDIILYSQNRECCGNFDGGGFLNAIVNQALAVGILWVNAAGNYGGSVFNGPIRNKESVSELRLKSHLDENQGQVILTWNSSGNEETTGTEKDLDLYVYDEHGKEVVKSVLKQVLKKSELGESETFLPRERIRFEFSKNLTGFYKIIVKAKSRNFVGSDRIRVVVIPDRQPVFNKEKNTLVGALELIDATQGGEIMTPADNPGVITVGDLSVASAKGPTADNRIKPEIIFENSVATFSNGESSQGTSNAAAYFAGVLAVLKSYRSDLTRSDVLLFPKNALSPSSFPVTELSIGEFSSFNSVIVNAVESFQGESALRAGRFQDGHYVIGIRKSPREVLTPICGEPKDESLEYYLALSSPAPKVLCFTRRVKAENGKKVEIYPWEYNGGSSQSYVEIRQIFPKGQVPSREGTWLTPTPEQLLGQYR